jgi:hypothetical protein
MRDASISLDGANKVINTPGVPVLVPDGTLQFTGREVLRTEKSRLNTEQNNEQSREYKETIIFNEWKIKAQRRKDSV